MTSMHLCMGRPDKRWCSKWPKQQSAALRRKQSYAADAGSERIHTRMSKAGLRTSKASFGVCIAWYVCFCKLTSALLYIKDDDRDESRQRAVALGFKHSKICSTAPVTIATRTDSRVPSTGADRMTQSTPLACI